MKKQLLLGTLCATMAFGLDTIAPEKRNLMLGLDTIAPEKRTFEQSKYIPDVSLIMDASFVNRDVEGDEELSHLEVPGVAHSLLGSHAHGEHAHATYNAEDGFNLNYAELVLSSSVDPFFTMNGVFHFSPDGVAIEELFFTSTALGYGLRAKGGKFNSNFGYLNQQHHHFWDFSDMPLVYESFLGMHGINEKGLQFQWTAPTDTYLMLGVEVLQGENDQMFGNGEIHLSELNATNADIESEDAPSMFIAYAKSSVDIGDTTILGGISYIQGSSRLDHTEDEDGPHAFSGDSKVYGADLVVKHFFDSYSSLKWQSEVLYRDMDGTQYGIDGSTGLASEKDLQKEQAGLYTQLVYAPNSTWRFGARYDTIFINDVTNDGADQNKPDDLDKYSVMVEYHTSEFARFRLQYNQNNALYNDEEKPTTVNTVMLSANISIGAHGAHAF